MLTLKDDPENIEICKMVHGKRQVPVNWHPRRKKELRNAIENLQAFNTQEFRDRFELSRLQADEIFEALQHDRVCEHNQSKHFKCKDFIQERLISEMNIEDQPSEFKVKFPPGQEFAWHHLIVGGTGSGKSFTASQMALDNLKGPKRDRRKFKYFSAEWNRDKTLKELRDKKYSEYVTGIDCSEESLKEGQWNTPEEFFKNEIKLRCEHAENCVIIFDDAMDMNCSKYIKPLINRMMRVARHQNVSLIVLLHCLRSASWSSQSHQSCRYLTVYPRSQRGKIRNFLNMDLGLTLSESRDIVSDFGQTARAMTIRLHCPQACINENLIRLF